ncbi:uncharacterized protein [Macrobrachium rosenbergii]|uniref:uncharacterized protein n=1 Tax=Macrobrachium rosenbergii TaxID=79674 RepID=UPI0034D5467D
MSTCSIDLQGNYISWSEGWVLRNVSRLELPLADLCKDVKIRSHFWFPNLYFDTAQYLCEALGADLPVVDSLKEVRAISEEANNTYPDSDVCSFEYWTSFSDSLEEGVWRYGNGQIPKNPIWLAQEPNGLKYENCAVLTIHGMADIDCKVDRKCVACTFKEQQRFSLLGSCESEVRNVYFVAYQKLLGELYFMGYGSYYIRKEGEQWVWVDDVKNETIARMETAKPNYPMGRRVWHLQRPVCDQEPNQKRTLLLTPCEENEYTCDDGSCVAHHKRCDLKYDCRDNSDEADCMLIDHPEGYQKHLPPRSNLGEDLSLLVVLSMRVSTMAVKTMEMAVDVTFELMLTWKDNRLQYLNLKVNDTLNVLALEAMKTLWTPDVTFVNAIGNHHTYVDEYTSMMINRSSEFKTRDETAPAEVEVFPGKFNALSIKRKYGITFDCSFNLLLYPFDNQECSMHLRITSAPKSFLMFDSVESLAINLGESLSAEYYIGGLKVGYEATGEYSEALIKIPLTRLAGYAILNIYIPTLVLLMISYMSLFVRTDMFDTRMMAALTVQLVIATLFSQVSSSLPKTSYFKMVDVWFMFCIAITFIVILFHGIIDNILYPGSGKISSIIQVGVAWMGPGSESKPSSASHKNEGDFMVKVSKIVVLSLFALFNVGYWGYILS